MREFFMDYIKGYLHSHRVISSVVIALLLLIVVLAIGIIAFDWDIAEIISSIGHTISRWLYGPLDRSFDGLQDYANEMIK